MASGQDDHAHAHAVAFDSDDGDPLQDDDFKMDDDREGDKGVGSSRIKAEGGDKGGDKKELKQACARCRQIKVRPRRRPLLVLFILLATFGQSCTLALLSSRPAVHAVGAHLDALALLAATAAPPGHLPPYPIPALSSALASLPPISGALPAVPLPTLSLAQPAPSLQPSLSLPLPPPSILTSSSSAPPSLPLPPPQPPISAAPSALISPVTASSRSGHFSYDSPNSLLDTTSPRPTLPSLSLMEVAQAKEAALASLSNGTAGINTAPKLATETILREPDPIDMHILSELEARQLFDHFHATLNKFVILLDLHLHKVDYVRRTSTVLFTTILAVSAKFFRPDLYASLLASSRQLIGRAIVDGKASVGLIQAICISTYWKQSHDSSAWLRVGLAIRMGYQLNLHAQRTTPLPVDEFEARLILDRERTWLVLVAFDHTYPLQSGDEDDGFHQTCMIPHYRINIEAWLEETRPYGVTDDLEQAANFEWIKVGRLSKDIARARPAHARALATHLQGMLDTTYARYLDPNSPQSLAPKEHATEKVTFFWYAASVSIHRALLVAVGTDGVALADWVRASSSFVDAFEAIAQQGLVPFWQDTLAVSLFSYGEFAVKIFNKVYPHNQTAILSWMERIYRACESASQGKEDSTAAFISRFFQLCIRTVCAPPQATDPAAAAIAAGVAAVPPPHPSSQPPTSAAPPTIASLTGQMVDSSLPTPTGSSLGPLDPALSTYNSMGLDANYWESLFPGHSTDWSWLGEGNIDELMRP
ncbi:hypothetical protein JCM6882_002380 [Rhodosporidiobolus microsporus]